MVSFPSWWPLVSNFGTGPDRVGCSPSSPAVFPPLHTSPSTTRGILFPLLRTEWMGSVPFFPPVPEPVGCTSSPRTSCTRGVPFTEEDGDLLKLDLDRGRTGRKKGRMIHSDPFGWGIPFPGSVATRPRLPSLPRSLTNHRMPTRIPLPFPLRPLRVSFLVFSLPIPPFSGKRGGHSTSASPPRFVDRRRPPFRSGFVFNPRSWMNISSPRPHDRGVNLADETKFTTWGVHIRALETRRKTATKHERSRRRRRGCEAKERAEKHRHRLGWRRDARWSKREGTDAKRSDRKGTW